MYIDRKVSLNIASTWQNLESKNVKFWKDFKDSVKSKTEGVLIEKKNYTGHIMQYKTIKISQ